MFLNNLRIKSNHKLTDEVELNRIERRFLKINRDRTDLTQQGLNDRQKGFIELLPLLFHENNPELPGYVNDEVPAGVFNYSPQLNLICQFAVPAVT